MKKIILIFGLVIGTILIANSIVVISMMYDNPDFKGNDIVGYSTMVIVFSLIYFGVRNYRNNHLEGKISFLNALKTGALICLVASTVYTILGLIYYQIMGPDFIDFYIDHVIRNSPPEEVETLTVQMASFKEMYKNPLIRIFITYMEVLPIGMIVALFSALIVRKN